MQQTTRRLPAKTLAATLFMTTATLAALPESAIAQDSVKHLALIGIQSGTVAPHGSGFAAVSLTDRRGPKLHDADGSAVVGFGFGDAEERVGVQVAAHITSLSSSFGDSGYLSLKFGRRLSEGPSPVYASLEFGQLANWGDATGRDETVSAAITRFSTITTADGTNSYPVMMTLGAGSDVKNFEKDPGVFAGFGIGLTESTAASIAWSGDRLTVGAGFNFSAAPDWQFALSVDDATDRLNDRRLILSVGYRFSNMFGG